MSRSWLTRLRNVFRSDAVSDEIEREMAFHIAQRTDDLIARGMSPDAARLEARRRFGDSAKHHDDTRARDLPGWLETLLADVRYALRGIRARPGPSVIIGLTLAFGLGVNATVFAMMDGMLLRPYQFRDHQRLVVLWDTPTGANQRDVVAAANFLDWRREATRVERLVAWEPWSVTMLGAAAAAAAQQEPDRLLGFRVSPSFFELIGVAPAIGRSFAGDEERAGNDRSIVISDGFWRRRFGANPAVVGSSVILDDVAYTIVGIAPPELDFPMASDVYAPLAFSVAQADDRKTRTLTVMGKLAPDASLEDARAELNVIGRRLEAQHPETNRGRGISIRTLSTAFVERAAFMVTGILQTAAALVLLIACANLAGLLLARSIDRRRELAVRVALGAGRMRIVRQLVTESVVISLIASALAIAAAQIGVGLLRSSVPADVARQIEGWSNVRVSWIVMLVIPALSIAIGVLVALFPALAALRGTSTAALKESDRGTIGSIPNLRGRQALVVAEIAFALAILIAAGLAVKSGTRMMTQPGGFDANRLLRFEVGLPERKYRDAAARRQFVSELTDRVAAIPGIERAAIANVLPASGWSPESPVLAEDQLIVENRSGQDLAAEITRWPRVGYRSVSDEFFNALRIPIVAGRGFSSADREDAPPVAVVSASFAQRFWPGRDPIGKRLRVGDTTRAWLTVVGVAGDVNMYNWWDGLGYDAVYVSLPQSPPSGTVHMLMRTHGGPTTYVRAARAALREVDAALPLDHARTMQEAVGESGRGLQLLATLLAACGAIAFVLAVIGIYGVMAYTFAQRTHEFGVRLAFGATGGDIVRLTLRRAVNLAAAGVAIGVPLAWMLARAMAGALHGVLSLDAMTFVTVAATLTAVSLVSAYLPARRALGLNPAAILRE